MDARILCHPPSGDSKYPPAEPGALV
jgi:hypothetical protein